MIKFDDKYYSFNELWDLLDALMEKCSDERKIIFKQQDEIFKKQYFLRRGCKERNDCINESIKLTGKFEGISRMYDLISATRDELCKSFYEDVEKSGGIIPIK